jgi:ribonuclease P protein component
MHPGQPAVAYSIGRPMGNAVRRNRIRRQLRARVQRDASLLDANRAYLVSVHPNSTNRDLADALSDCLRRAVGM